MTENEFDLMYEELRRNAFLFYSEAEAAKFISSIGAVPVFPIVGFCAGYIDSGEGDGIQRETFEAVKYGFDIVICIISSGSGKSSVRLLTKAEHESLQKAIA